MTPDGSKVVMAIRDRIDPNNHDSSQTTKILSRTWSPGR